LHRQTPFELAVTSFDGGQSIKPYCQGETARFVSFQSTADLMGNGSSGSEIFLFDNQPPRNTRQITNCAFGESENPTNVSDGHVVVFDSTSDLASPPSQRCKAPLPTRQIFRATNQQGSLFFEQLTSGNVDCSNPQISTDGFRIVFQCTGDLR